MAYGDNGYGDEFVRGILFTLQISVCGYILAFVLGLLGAGAKLHGSKALYRVGDLYTTLVRAIPELLLILMIYYMGSSALNAALIAIGITERGIDISPFAAAVAALGFIYGAYLTDILRGAIQAIPKGQIEAARAYGMHAPMRFRRIVFPQMIRYAIPGMGNQWLNITKDSALVSAIGAFELAVRCQERGIADQGIHLLLFGRRPVLPRRSRSFRWSCCSRSNAAPVAASGGHRRPRWTSASCYAFLHFEPGPGFDSCFLLWTVMPMLIRAIPLSFFLLIVSGVIGNLLAVPVAVARMSRNPDALDALIRLHPADARNAAAGADLSDLLRPGPGVRRHRRCSASR